MRVGAICVAIVSIFIVHEVDAIDRGCPFFVEPRIYGITGDGTDIDVGGNLLVKLLPRGVYLRANLGGVRFGKETTTLYFNNFNNVEPAIELLGRAWFGGPVGFYGYGGLGLCSVSDGISSKQSVATVGAGVDFGFAPRMQLFGEIGVSVTSQSGNSESHFRFGGGLRVRIK